MNDWFTECKLCNNYKNICKIKFWKPKQIKGICESYEGELIPTVEDLELQLTVANVQINELCNAIKIMLSTNNPDAGHQVLKKIGKE